MPAKQSRFTMILFGIVAIGVVILAAAILLWNLQITNTRRIEEKWQANEKQYTDIKQDLSNASNEANQLASLEDTLKSLETNLADYKYMPTYLQQMQHTAMLTGNTIESIAPEAITPLDFSKGPLASVAALATPTAAGTPTPQKPQYLVQPITLEVKGSFVSTVRLLDAFRRFPKLIYVRTVDLSPTREHNQLVITTRLRTYAIITPDQYLALPNNPEVKR
jgi:Tfp pilus assembly protein PilO